MKTKPKNRLVACMMGGVLLLASTLMAAPAHASEAPQPDTAPVTSEVQLSAEQKADLQSLLAGIESTSGVFHADRALAAGVSESDVADFAASFEASGGTVSDLPSTTKSEISAQGKQIAMAAASCKGSRGYTGFYGWGWQFALNSCDTDLLIAAVGGAGTSYAALGGLIAVGGVTAPAGAVTIAVGGIIAAGAVPLSICKAASYGKKAIFLNAYIGGGIGCWGQ